MVLIPTKCPKCGVNLELPNSHDASKPWTRAKLVAENGKALAFKCPDCEAEWPLPWTEKPHRALDME